METTNERWKRMLNWMATPGNPWGKGGGNAEGSDGSGDGSGGGDGGKDPRNPWSMPPGGGGKRPKGPRGPSAFDELARQFRSSFGGKLPEGGDSGTVKRVAIGAGALFILFNSFTNIAPEQQGVFTIFGKYMWTYSSGISATVPWPIGSVQKVDVRATNKVDIPTDSGKNFILTSDQNIIDLDYQVRWNVKAGEARNFVFQLSNTQTTIYEVGESAMREVLSTVTFIDAMGPSRGLIEQRVALRMQELLDEYRAGVSIQGVSIMKAGPPEDVRDAFNEVTAAQQNRQTAINNARAYSQQVRSIAIGESTAFDKVYAQYKLAPEVTRRRMYYETMEQILSKTNKTIVEPNAVAPLLPLNRAGQSTSVTPTIQVSPPAGAGQ